MAPRLSLRQKLGIVLSLLWISATAPVHAGVVDRITGAAELVPKEIFKPYKPSQAPDLYGPTPINAQLGNQGLSVGLRKNGTVSTYSWPRPSMYDQVKFQTVSRGQDNWGAAANAGLQLGFQLKVQTGTVEKKDGCKARHWWGGCKAWHYKTVPVHDKKPTLLRNWQVTGQQHSGAFNDVVTTRYRNQDLGLRVTVTDLVPINENVSTSADGDPGTYNGYEAYSEALNGDALVRRVRIRYIQGRQNDPVKNARVFSYANFNLTGNHHPYLPTSDWAEPLTKMEDAYYDGGDDAIYHMDKDRNNPERVIAMAFGNKSARADHVQVGYDNIACTSPSFDCASNFAISSTMDLINTLDLIPGVDMNGMHVNGAWHDFMEGGKDGKARLSGWMNACPGGFPWDLLNWCATLRGYFTSSGMTSELLLTDGQSVGQRDVIFANGHDKTEVQDLLNEVRYQLDFDSAVAAKRRWFTDVLSDAEIPRANPDIEALASRSLVTLVQNYDPRSGAIVASIARQSPYAEDWPRDGAYFNHVLDRELGLHQWVEKRNYWYADLQKQPTDSSQPLVPAGNWAMNYYGNGKIGGVIPWEVDETGYMVWAFWDHYQATGDQQYLAGIYPALQRAADFLVNFKDPDNGLQKPAYEDDQFTKSQTLVGATTTWLAMKAAEKAARELGYSADADRYARRKRELDDAINAELWNRREQAWGFQHLAQAELAWPARFRPWRNPRMQRHLTSAGDKVAPTFQQPNGPNDTNSEGRVKGLYETKTLIALAKSARATGNRIRLDRVKKGLNWVADKWATPDTHIMGEVWMKCGEPDTAWPCDDPNSAYDYKDGIMAVVSQPHAWEQALFYLGAVEAYPTSPINP